MYIACIKNNGIDYLQVHESYSVRENGETKRKSRFIRSIGPLSRFNDGQPDYLARLRQSFKEGRPIIPSLADLANNNPAPSLLVRFDMNTECYSDPKNIGYFLMDGLYDALGIYDVLKQYKSNNNIPYDLNGLAKVLVFGRILDPDSKLGTYEERERYVFEVTHAKSLYEIYHALDGLNDCADAIQRRMNYKISNGSIGRNTEICFYDVTNYYFEIGENDPDEVGENGKVIKKGLRKKGVSKEKRGEPIVQMGLFIDDNGIPIAYRLFPGNDTDQTTLRPALKENIDNLGVLKVIWKVGRFLFPPPNISTLIS